MLPSFLPPDTHGPMEPLIFSSLEHFTSNVALNAILNSPFGSLEKHALKGLFKQRRVETV